METLEQFVKSSLQQVGLKVDTRALIQHLVSLGVEHPSDVHLLTEDNLTDVLKVIQARKLLACWGDSSTRYVLL